MLYSSDFQGHQVFSRLRLRTFFVTCYHQQCSIHDARTANHDGGDIIDLCLAQPACPRFLAHKLLRAFVLDQPEKAHVAALAARIRARDFAMGAVLRELLASDFFYTELARAGLR